jgi:uncharacterized protein YjiS (DUF1127 family)
MSTLMIHPLRAPLWVAAARAIWRRAQARAAALSAGIQRWRSQRTTRRALGALDDRLLRDIGLGRGEIPAVAARPGDADRRLIGMSSS